MRLSAVLGVGKNRGWRSANHVSARSAGAAIASSFTQRIAEPFANRAYGESWRDCASAIRGR